MNPLRRCQDGGSLDEADMTEALLSGGPACDTVPPDALGELLYRRRYFLSRLFDGGDHYAYVEN